MSPTKEDVAACFKAKMDFLRFAKLTKAIGSQLNGAQLRFLKSFIFEISIEEYSNNAIKYIGEEGCDLYILELGARVEMKYTEDAIYTSVRKKLRENTGNIKLMNILFYKPTLDAYVKSQGDGIIANIPTSKGIILATPEEMSADFQQEVDFLEGHTKYVKTYINNIK